MREIASKRNQACIKKGKLAIGYLLAGFPQRDSFLHIISDCEAAGLDVLEVGYPSEDPIADGEVIRRSHALVDISVQTDLTYWKKIRDTVNIPIWIMAYKKDLIDSDFYKLLVTNGLVDAIVIPDATFELRYALLNELLPFGVDVLGFVTPDMEREELDACFQNFTLIYQQLYSGPTGMSVETPGYEKILAHAKKHKHLRIFAGFGISTTERAEKLLESGFDGVIVGTAMMLKLNASREVLTTFVKDLKNTVKKGAKSMGYIATFDIGTTAVKGVLMSTDGRSIMEKSINIETIFDGDYKEQRPLDWYSVFCEISHLFFMKGLSPKEVRGIVMSGQMQDLIPVGEDLKPVCNAILYSDGRAGLQAQEIASFLGIDVIEKSTGNHFDGSMPFPKLLWLKQNEPDLYEATEKILVSSKDYVITRLTGEFITDVTSASTAGLMDIHNKCWNKEWIEMVGLDSEKLPAIRFADEQAGAVKMEASKESGYEVGTPVYVGTGDAGATTLASGISMDGEFNINLGTSGWIACVSADVMLKSEVFNLVAMPRNSYINVVPFLNAGNVHKWISQTLGPDNETIGKYEYMNGLLSQSEAGSNGVMFLPYLVGERFPVMDTAIKGSFVGISPESTKQDLARSTLEGVAFSIRQGLESIGRTPSKISLIGGGTQVTEWCQIIADVLGYPVYVYRESEYLPAAAMAAAVLIEQGELLDYASFVNSLQNSGESLCYIPIPENVKLYNLIYPNYLKIYPALKSLT